MSKPNKMSVRPAKTQISLGIHPVWSESSLCAQWVVKGPRFLHADSGESAQTGRMPRLIWVFAGRTAILLVLSCRGSNLEYFITSRYIRSILPQQGTFIFRMFSTLPSWAQNLLLASINQPIKLTVTDFQQFCNCQWEDLQDIQGGLRICFYSVAN